MLCKYYNLLITWAHKKRQAEACPVLYGVVQTPCFPNAQTIPTYIGTRMDAIDSYRRFSLRRLLYNPPTTLPVFSLQPVISCGRDPPSSQTHYE